MQLRTVLVLLCSVFAAGAGLRLRAREAANEQGMNPSVERVVRMLENLITEMDTEEAQDEQQFGAFQEWCGTQTAATEASVGTLKATIETLSASLSELYAQKNKLTTEIAKLDAEIQTTQNQMKTAADRRTEEHTSFQKEQTDFEGAIAATSRAVDILKEHYGEPSAGPSKPAWMSFVQVGSQIKAAIQRGGHYVSPQVESFLESGSLDRSSANPYQESHAESGNIVDQIKVLSETFAEDKQSSIDEENRLLKLFTNLMAEKQELLTSLQAQRADRQSVLNVVNQDIGEKETAKANAEAELQDEMAYLAQTKKQCADTAELFKLRQQDRAAEKIAVGEAVKVLNGSAGGASFLQTASSHRHSRRMSRKLGRCAKCSQAAALLSQAARAFKSGVLATAAAATATTSAMQGVEDVISALEELVHRIDEDQAMEKSHKEWCESEMSETTSKKTTHEAAVADFTQKIADETETVAEKKRAITDTNVAIATVDQNFKEAEQLRETDRQSYEVELQNYKDAIAALNQAMDILAKFYATQEAPASFLQTGAYANTESYADDSVAPRAVTPGVFSNVYEQKGGTGVVEMVATVRKEFESGKADLEKGERQAVADFQGLTDEYHAARGDLVNQLNRVTTELQTAEGNLDQFKEDLAANQKEVQAAQSYLDQLSGSCNSLLENYDNRVKLRSEEKQAIKDAIKVLGEQ